MKTALLQMTSGDKPDVNLTTTIDLITRAKAAGADFVLTPEVTNCLSDSRSHQTAVLNLEQDDRFLAEMQDAAARHGIWLLLGSLALKTDDPDGRFANRSFLIAPSGDITARYDKIHMFDVDVSETETYRESAGYRPGRQAVLAQTSFAKIGMTVCFDVRFPLLFRRLAQAGAEVLTVPAAFSAVTGEAHWHTLLRARAIETGCYVLAPAQTGTHDSGGTRPRKTYGHSLAVDPWGTVIADAGVEPGITLVDLDMSKVPQSRRRIASVTTEAEIDGP